LWITFRLKPGGVEIEARDDGQSGRIAESGFGLTAMAKRFEEMGGVVSFETGKERGFSVRAWLPTHDREG
jgi:signal transduction histidine kinase